MAGMEGGPGGPPLEWGEFWKFMLLMTATLISLAAFGLWMGWIH